MKAYISLEECKARFGTMDPKELINKKIKSPYGEPWRIVKAELKNDGIIELILK